jgi:dephospho-CoA kinase
VAKPVIGLIGGIGSGKSRVAAELARHGGIVISGDKLGHEALHDLGIKAAVIERWGKGILDAAGNIDRRRLGKIVFADPNERQALEKWAFPFIERRIGEEIDKIKQNQPAAFVVLDAAVMLEAGWNKFCDRLVYVKVPRAIRLKRLAEQRGFNEEDVRARENAQWSDAEKEKQADFVLDNSGSPEELAREIDDLVKKLVYV